jgi:hypothetical protein
MKEGWEIKKLGDECKVIAGQSPEGKFYNSEGNEIPFYQGKKEYGEKYIEEPATWTTKITKEAEEEVFEREKMSESRFSGLENEQDLKNDKKKILSF